MSVVVNVKMPKKCVQCDFYDPDVDICVPTCERVEDDVIKLDNCPIIAELPKCHGRLIDADDFLKFLKALTKHGAPYQSVIDLLDNSQEIIVAAEGEHENSI